MSKPGSRSRNFRGIIDLDRDNRHKVTSIAAIVQAASSRLMTSTRNKPEHIHRRVCSPETTSSEETVKEQERFRLEKKKFKETQSR